jgi:hypothetical protein
VAGALTSPNGIMQHYYLGYSVDVDKCFVCLLIVESIQCFMANVCVFVDGRDGGP